MRKQRIVEDKQLEEALYLSEYEEFRAKYGKKVDTQDFDLFKQKKREAEQRLEENMRKIDRTWRLRESGCPKAMALTEQWRELGAKSIEKKARREWDETLKKYSDKTE